MIDWARECESEGHLFMPIMTEGVDGATLEVEGEVENDRTRAEDDARIASDQAAAAAAPSMGKVA